MDHQILLFRLDADLMEAFARIGPVRRVPQAVLVAQLFLQPGVDLFDGLFFGDLEKSAASFL